MTSAPALEARDVRFAHPDGRVALDGVDLTVAAGEQVAILGPNGAGKTTLMLHLNGIHRPAAGEVRIGGTVVDTRDRARLREVRRRVGLVFQDPDDQLFMPTVRADVAFGPANLGVTGTELAARVDEALAAVGMAHTADRHPQHLSMGERRRVAVATVLAMRPDVLVLDEPSSNLDPRARRELVEVLRTITGERSLTLLLVTHDLPLALELCARSVVLDAGRVVADGPTTELLDDDELLARHRLELPYGFDRALVRDASRTTTQAPIAPPVDERARSNRVSP
jgi:cobalt/nickel transport system ATP-binding protein